MSKRKINLDNKLLIGRYEWCALPKLNVPAIRAKVDTGAKTSAIHAFNIKPFNKRGKQFVAFDIHPIQQNDKVIVHCEALVVDRRLIMSSNGHKENRFVILTPFHLGNKKWEIELTLSNRDPLKFRMLIGREAIKHRVLIDPGLTYNQIKMKRQAATMLYDFPNKYPDQIT